MALPPCTAEQPETIPDEPHRLGITGTEDEYRTQWKSSGLKSTQQSPSHVPGHNLKDG